MIQISETQTMPLLHKHTPETVTSQVQMVEAGWPIPDRDRTTTHPKFPVRLKRIYRASISVSMPKTKLFD